MSITSSDHPATAPAVRPRGADVAPFYTSLVARQAADLSRAGRPVIPMHFGQPSAGTPPGARAAAAHALALDPTGYVESRELIERIARHYREVYGVDVAPVRILLTNGASAALVAAFAALFGPGDRIGICRPGYPAYRNALAALSREAVEIDCGLDTGFRLTAGALTAIDPPLNGLIVASPANPTGAMLDRAQLTALARECSARGIRLLSDEIYHGISFGARAVSALEVEPEAIIINSFSKLYRMPGWRLGWLVVPEALAARLSAYVINLFLTPPTLSQHAALAAFDDGEELARTVDSYRVNRDLLLGGLAAMGITRIAPPDGAFYLYANVGHLTRDSLAFCRRLLADTGVATAPGIDFDPVNGQRFIRLSFAITTPEIERALELLGPWLARQPRLDGPSAESPDAGGAAQR
ncbi:MAG TPA: aminotransferase class I/II-fold pyridoxal phosphate-dependent enzyme [Steroidobacteraceae bacterium]|nr:aminotransferase class I/II-fold pyridoxal phosphate-dependent enzyme [Steroidobacteraceae bacterium]